MKSKHAGLLALGVMVLSGSMAAQAADGDLTCRMSFKLSGWSAIYKTAKGRATVRCSNGQTLSVKLSTTGGGLTAGKSTEQGTGKFSGVRTIDDVLGSYVAASGQAGAVNSVQGQVLTKGEVSLALSGKGSGWSLGVALSEFKIER